ncbi:hypothetical protein JXC34_05695 [Candidatus Woesearchaeota archaeon]|nr:hypothetical protein [Candidatus Woesearchaeota archaeon]
MKKDLGFNSTLEELDEVFYFTDYILQVKFISPKLSRMLCGRIRDTFNLWITQLHAWLVPNPYSMIGLSESQAFNDKEKEEITKIMAKFMAFTSQNILIGLTKDKMKEAEYFDNAMTLWNDSKPIFIKYSKKVNEYWKSRLGD